MHVFLSYRRSDTGGYAGRLTDALAQRIGAKSVFQDVSTIAPGQDFTIAVDNALDQCQAVLAVIGPGWLTASAAGGRHRLDDPEDYVRRELAQAIDRDAVVVPVLVGGATLPSSADLPPALRGLARRQAVVLHDETWHQDVDGLLASLRGEQPQPRRQRRLLLPAAGAALLAFGIGVVLWQTVDPGGAGGTARDSAAAGSTSTASAAPLRACEPDGPQWHKLPLNDDRSVTTNVKGGHNVYQVNAARWASHGAGTWRVVLATQLENATGGLQYHGDWLYRSLAAGARDAQPSCFRADPEVLGAHRIGDAVVGFDVKCEPTGLLQLRVDEAPVTGDLDVTPSTLPIGAC